MQILLDIKLQMLGEGFSQGRMNTRHAQVKNHWSRYQFPNLIDHHRYLGDYSENGNSLASLPLHFLIQQVWGWLRTTFLSFF